MTQSKLNDELEAPFDPGSDRPRRHGDVMAGTPTRLPSSRVARGALAVASAAMLVTLGVLAGWGLDLLSEREMVFPLAFCLGASVLSGTLAAIGWMHSKRRRDGAPDPVGVRRSLIAGALAAITLIGVTIAIGQIGSHQGVQTEIPPAASTPSPD